MAGGIDWFRWHHGSTTDPKFQLVARQAGASLPDVLAVWAYLLESASGAQDRGDIGDIDAEALDCMFGFPATETRTANVMAAMEKRGLLAGGRITAWDRRQPKREDDTAAERKRRQREREHEERMAAAVTPEASRNVTPRPATVTPGHDRGEESREVISKTSSSHPPGGGLPAGFAEFWTAWPKNERKQDKAKCAAVWKQNALGAVQSQILADVRVKRGTEKWQGGFIEAPLVYLRNKRWEDGVTPNTDGDNELADWRATRSGIERMGESLGLGRWDENAAQLGRGELFAAYERRVMDKVEELEGAPA